MPRLGDSSSFYMENSYGTPAIRLKGDSRYTVPGSSRVSVAWSNITYLGIFCVDTLTLYRGATGWWPSNGQWTSLLNNSATGLCHVPCAMCRRPSELGVARRDCTYLSLNWPELLLGNCSLINKVLVCNINFSPYFFLRLYFICFKLNNKFCDLRSHSPEEKL